ncbi:hypothetical protein SLA2020_163570 [Shorea laevis]
MAANHTSFLKAQRNVQGFTAVLTNTACELFLIFLLLVDGVFSYLLTKFARYCKLQIPCIFCSRLDHVLGNEKPGFYWNLICSNHRSEISSLISCNVHGKLADGFGMCEDCLLSSAMKNKSKSDMNVLFLGELGFNLGGCGTCRFPSLFLNRDFVASTITRLCLCCNKPWVPTKNCQRLIQLQSSEIEVTKPNIPLPCCLSRGASSKMTRDKFSGPVTSSRLRRNDSDPLPHAGYTELKIDSESESEVSFSDDDGGRSVFCDINEHKEESVVHCAPEIPPKRGSNDLAPKMQPDASESRDVKCLAPDVVMGCDAHELNWQQADQKANLAALPELISLDDIPPSSRDAEVPYRVLSPISHNHSVMSDLISLVDPPPSIHVKEVNFCALPEKLADVTVTSAVENISINKNEEILKVISTTTRAGFKADELVSNEDPSDVYKSSVNGKEKQMSEILAQQPQVKYNSGLTKDLRLLLVQDSCSQGIHSSLDNLGPVSQGLGADLRTTDESNSDGIQNLDNTIVVDSLDGSGVSEIEGESVVDRLKRQIEYDRKCINALYKELEEERNASEIAANHAMAMITRLQEEKSALHLEAMQYLRMMEEQAEYDGEALEKANDLLAEKEKEIQDLETELEFCRLYVLDKPLEETIPVESVDLKEENLSVNDTSISCKEENASVHQKSVFPDASEGCDSPSLASSWADFADEKSYISERLKNLERKLQKFAYQRTLSYIPDGDFSEEAADMGGYQGEFINENDKQISCQMKDNGLAVQKESLASNGSATHEGSNASIGRSEVGNKENGHIVPNGQNGFKSCEQNDLVPLENEVSDLNDRLEALEADFNFLEHSINSLQSGSEGLCFVQDIAYQLQELRKIWITRKGRPVSGAYTCHY